MPVRAAAEVLTPRMGRRAPPSLQRFMRLCSLSSGGWPVHIEHLAALGAGVLKGTSKEYVSGWREFQLATLPVS
ncbi:unnamed protein product [Gadus morhua 'NCC']